MSVFIYLVKVVVVLRDPSAECSPFAASANC